MRWLLLLALRLKKRWEFHISETFAANCMWFTISSLTRLLDSEWLANCKGITEGEAYKNVCPIDIVANLPDGFPMVTNSYKCAYEFCFLTEIHLPVHSLWCQIEYKDILFCCTYQTKWNSFATIFLISMVDKTSILPSYWMIFSTLQLSKYRLYIRPPHTVAGLFLITEV